MQGWMKKNQKKLLAVMGAFLMVSFLISVPIGSLTQGGRTHGPVYAKVGKTVIYADEHAEVERELHMLEQSYYIDLDGRQPMPKAAIDLLGPAIVNQLKDHPDLFLMLIKEAEQRGIDVSSDVVAKVMAEKIRSFSVPPTDPTYESAIHHLLVVQALRNELVSDMKFSEPQWNHYLAEEDREVRLNIVEFNAEKVARGIAPPTTQQVQAQYDAYKDVLPDAAMKPKGDELGFAYKIPNRVKLQYLTIARDQILKAVREAQRKPGDKPDELPYDLKVKAYEYYLNNQTEFVRAAPETKPTTSPAALAPSTQATQPTTAQTTAATNPTTQPTTVASAIASTQPSATTEPTTVASTQPAPATTPTTVASTQPMPATQPTTVATKKDNTPTTRPFVEVQDEIVNKLLKPDADALQKQVGDAVRQKLADAWQPAGKISPATQPTTQPSTGPTTQPSGVFAYADLEKIREEIQQQFKVSIEITQLAEWQDAKALASLKGIGESEADKTPFPQYVMDNSAAFTTDPARKLSGLQVGQASPLFTDFHENGYVFRLTDTSPAHAPDLTSIRPRVEEDARLKAAYDRANELAKEFVDDAKKESFGKAAANTNRQVISTGSFNLRQLEQFPFIPNFKANPESITVLGAKTAELLSQASAANPNPMAVVPMPADRAVIVAQLADVTMEPRGDSFRQRMQANRSAIIGSEGLSESYFNYDTVAKRLNYTVEKPENSSGS
jgi:hypothetical protein